MLNLNDMTHEEFLVIYAETEAAWRRLTQREPDNPLPWCGLGAIRNQRENFEGSMYAYNTALTKNPMFLNDRQVDQAIYQSSRAGRKWTPPDPTFLLNALFLQAFIEMIEGQPPPVMVP